MTFVRKFFFFACFFTLTHQTYAQSLVLYNVPFQNISLAAHTTLQATFSFGLNPEIFCFTSSSAATAGLITWPYNGSTLSAQLPILLKTKAIFEGQFSDSVGILTITNTTNTRLQVACLFGF